MKKITRKKALLLLIIGMLIIAFSQILAYYVTFPDFAKGSLVGIGIGLLGTSLFLGDFKTANR